MKIVSFMYGEHSCGICVYENDKIVHFLEEERYCKVKYSIDFSEGTFRYPTHCLEKLEKINFDYKDVDYFLFPKPEGRIEEFINLCLSCDIPNIKSLNHKIITYDHHDSHAALAYYTSGFSKNDNCLVITMDGSGDNFSSKYFLANNNKMNYISGNDVSRNSFGMYYCLLTEFLGFKRIKDEGKVVGMSSHGKYDEFYYSLFENTIGEIDDIFTMKNEHGFGEMFQYFYTKFFEDVGSLFYKKTKVLNDIAYNGQLVFENKICEVINNLHKKFPSYNKLCLSGGCFANVKLNKRINELEWVDEVYVTPSMDDNGLTIGSTLLQNSKIGEQEIIKLENVYFGTEYSEKEVMQIFDNCKKIKYMDLDLNKVSNLLVHDNIIGLFQGKMEGGPRALGNRSIITRPDIPYEKLNKRLHRNDFMPFAPTVLQEHAENIFDIQKSKYTAQFMNMLYDVKPDWIEKIKSACHPIDHTARIQLLYRDVNVLFYDIIDNFFQKTGIPVLINTSFNVHNDPIVEHPSKAFEYLTEGVVDYLIMGNKIFYTT